ncbi:hypothetical protein C5B85_10835 [Pseudoclavibacter sp. AY1F1]|nr:hypothetical protein C5B85_10835 [Pseudoclavibacter sp. AY1F1]
MHGQRLLLAVLARLRPDETFDAIRDACRRSGVPAVAAQARSRSSWNKALRLHSSFAAGILPSGQAGGLGERERLAESAARRLVGRLTLGGPDNVVTARQHPQAKATLAVMGLAEIKAATDKGWSGSLATGSWIATELGMGRATGSRMLTLLEDARWVTKVRRAAGAGRAHVYRLKTLSGDARDQWAREASIHALASGQAEPLADLIRAVTLPGMNYGQAALGMAVWLWAVEQIADVDAGLSPSARASARKRLRELGITAEQVAEHARTHSDGEARRLKAEAEQAREQAAADLAEASKQHTAKVREAGKLLRSVLRAAHPDPGKIKAPGKLVPPVSTDPAELAVWSKNLLVLISQRLPPKVRPVLAPQIAKQLRAALVDGGHSEARADTISSKLLARLAPPKVASEGPDNERQAA